MGPRDLRGKKTEWHFFHCLTQYGEVARFVWLKSASGDIQLLLLIQTLPVLSPGSVGSEDSRAPEHFKLKTHTVIFLLSAFPCPPPPLKFLSQSYSKPVASLSSHAECEFHYLHKLPQGALVLAACCDRRIFQLPFFSLLFPVVTMTRLFPIHGCTRNCSATHYHTIICERVKKQPSSTHF